MIRQAHTYLAGALSGTALVAAAAPAVAPGVPVGLAGAELGGGWATPAAGGWLVNAPGTPWEPEASLLIDSEVCSLRTI